MHHASGHDKPVSVSYVQFSTILLHQRTHMLVGDRLVPQ